MCHATTCGKCNKTSWAGCGNHLDSVFRNVPVDNRCFCGFDSEEALQKHMKEGEEKNKYGPYPLGGGGCVIM